MSKLAKMKYSLFIQITVKKKKKDLDLIPIKLTMRGFLKLFFTGQQQQNSSFFIH